MVAPATNRHSRTFTDTDPTGEARGGAARPASAARGAQPAQRTITDKDVARAFARLDATWDANLAIAAKNATAARPPRDNGILFIGFNMESEANEAKALGRDGVRVRTLPPAETSATIAGKKYDLKNDEGIRSLVASLNLDPRQAPEVEEVIRRATLDQRGKTAQLASVFAEAEHGKPIPSRLVISAHSGGVEFYGSNGHLRPDSIRDLARAMPRAGACIEDIHFSACSSSGQASLDGERGEWQRALPNLKTMWGYTGSTGKRSLIPHLETWARATSSPHDGINLPRSLSHQHIATWSKTAGYRDDISVADLRKQQSVADGRFSTFSSGQRNAEESVDALQDYEAYRMLSQRNELPQAERAMFAHKADQMLRLRYQPSVVSEFSKRYANEIQAGYQAMGLPVPSFDPDARAEAAEPARRKALANISAFEVAFARQKDPSGPAKKLSDLLRGLKDLDPKILPESDCHHRSSSPAQGAR